MFLVKNELLVIFVTFKVKTNEQTNQQTNQPTNQPTNQQTNQPTNQPKKHLTVWSWSKKMREASKQNKTFNEKNNKWANKQMKKWKNKLTKNKQKQTEYSVK